MTFCFTGSKRSGSLPVLIGLDEFQPAIPWQVASSRACFHFAGRERFSKTKPSRTMIFQRTATTPLNSVSQPKGAVQPFPSTPSPKPQICTHRKNRCCCGNLKLEFLRSDQL